MLPASIRCRPVWPRVPTTIKSAPQSLASATMAAPGSPSRTAVSAFLLRQPDFAASKTFVAWNVLGILDLVVAVGTGAFGPLLFGDGVGAVTTAPMAHLPLVLIPAYFVPVFIILHLTALFQARQRAGYSSRRS